jgi:hypothetical protein
MCWPHYRTGKLYVRGGKTDRVSQIIRKEQSLDIVTLSQPGTMNDQGLHLTKHFKQFRVAHKALPSARYSTFFGHEFNENPDSRSVFSHIFQPSCKDNPYR